MEHKQNAPVAIIMAGGAGTRFWPLSKKSLPKQFLSLCSQRTLLQECFDRLQGLVEPERILVLTNMDFVDIVHEQLPEIPREHIFGEPCRRDTAGAVALGSLLAQRLFGDCTIVTLASDPCIQTTGQFQVTLGSAIRAAQASPTALYTVGIPPTYPAVAYGYLHRGERLTNGEEIPHYQLQDFREKPDLATATSYVQSGEYYWNCGMFIWQSQAIISELRRCLPRHAEILEPVMQAWDTPSWDALLAQEFAKLERISIDFGVMEKAQDVRMVEALFSWYDVGNWLALKPFMDRDDNGNHSKGQLSSYSAENNIVYCTDPLHRVALVGVSDLVVIQTQRQTLVVAKDRLEEVKKLVALLPEAEQ